MPKYSSAHVQAIVFGGYDLRAHVNRTAFGTEQLSEEQIPPGANYPVNHQLGIHRSTLQQSGLFDDDALGSHNALVALQGASTSGIYARFGNTAGLPCKVFRGMFASEVSEPTPAGQLVKFDATYKVDGDVGESIVLLPQQVIDEDDNSIYNTTEALTDGGCIICIQVIGLVLDGADDLTVTVDDSDDAGGPWVALTSQVMDTDGPHAFYVVTTGDVDQYLRVTWAFGGTPGDDTAAQLLVSFKRLPALS